MQPCNGQNYRIDLKESGKFGKNNDVARRFACGEYIAPIDAGCYLARMNA